MAPPCSAGVTGLRAGRSGGSGGGVRGGGGARAAAPPGPDPPHTEPDWAGPSRVPSPAAARLAPGSLGCPWAAACAGGRAPPTGGEGSDWAAEEVEAGPAPPLGSSGPGCWSEPGGCGCVSSGSGGRVFLSPGPGYGRRLGGQWQRRQC